jgi:hypothetical protein
VARRWRQRRTRYCCCQHCSQIVNLSTCRPIFASACVPMSFRLAGSRGLANVAAFIFLPFLLGLLLLQAGGSVNLGLAHYVGDDLRPQRRARF